MTRRRMIISGRLSATTDIMKASTVPRATPLSIKTLTTGMIPAAFEYNGMPRMTASGTAQMVSLPSVSARKSSGTKP